MWFMGLFLGSQPCNPFALVISPRLGLRHRWYYRENIFIMYRIRRWKLPQNVDHSVIQTYTKMHGGLGPSGMGNQWIQKNVDKHFWCHKPKLKLFSLNIFTNTIWTSPTRSSRITIPTKMHKGGMLLLKIIHIFASLLLYGLEFKIPNFKSKYIWFGIMVLEV
jgi:hypothetical protein